MLDSLAKVAGDSVTESHTEGLGQQLLNSFVGMIVGIVLFLGSFVILWWNEGNVIAEKDALTEMSKALVKGSAESPNAAHNGKLIHATGKLESPDKLGDAPYLKPGAYLALDRKVEMYQWIEKEERKSKKNLGGSKTTTTTYTYEKGWAEGYIDSGRFKNPTGHANPPLTVQPVKTAVKKSHFGKFDGKEVLAGVPSKQDLPVTAAMLEAPAKGKEKEKPVIQNGLLYLKKTPGSAGDNVGDVRISYKVIKPGTFSVIAKQSGKKLAPYHAKNGKEKFIVMAGAKPPQAMIQAEKEAAGAFAMFLRFLGFLVMWIGMNLLAGPIVTMLDVLPFLGSASRIVLAVVFFVASLVLSLVTIVLSMIAHHPVALVLFLAAAAGGGYYLYQRKQQAKGAAAPRHGGGDVPAEPPQAASGSKAPSKHQAA